MLTHTCITCFRLCTNTITITSISQLSRNWARCSPFISYSIWSVLHH